MPVQVVNRPKIVDCRQLTPSECIAVAAVARYDYLKHYDNMLKLLETNKRNRDLIERLFNGMIGHYVMSCNPTEKSVLYKILKEETVYEDNEFIGSITIEPKDAGDALLINFFDENENLLYQGCMTLEQLEDNLFIEAIKTDEKYLYEE